MKRTIIISLVVIAILLAGCTSRAPAFPVGKYQDDCCSKLWTFHADGKITLEGAGGASMDNGSYLVEKDLITISIIEVARGRACETAEGVYKWSVAEDGILQFETVEDECQERRLPLVKGLTPLP